jgi:hypothetical protein
MEIKSVHPCVPAASASPPLVQTDGGCRLLTRNGQANAASSFDWRHSGGVLFSFARHRFSLPPSPVRRLSDILSPPLIDSLSAGTSFADPPFQLNLRTHPPSILDNCSMPVPLSHSLATLCLFISSQIFTLRYSSSNCEPYFLPALLSSTQDGRTNC